MPSPPHPILIVSYTKDTLAALTATLNNSNVAAAPCSSFCEAENLALEGLYSGLLVDLPSMIKSKGEEKIVACTLANFFPTLRVRALGSMLVPMSMPGIAKQDKDLNDFLKVTCPAFNTRKLRRHKRHNVSVSTLLHHNDIEFRGFTLDLAWGGAFIADMFPERFPLGEEVAVQFVEFGFEVRCTICSITPWGQRNASGIGVSFNDLDETAESALTGLLKTRKEFDRDRLVA
ncbi:MAG: PilZ domain-containing protein [Steroidobacteraceae bacterium]|nr:PilZ domain-containing protein [Deltaproteobacteria bacterium]